MESGSSSESFNDLITDSTFITLLLPHSHKNLTIFLAKQQTPELLSLLPKEHHRRNDVSVFLNSAKMYLKNMTGPFVGRK